MAMPKLIFAYSGPARGLIRAWYRSRVITPAGRTQEQFKEELVAQLRIEIVNDR